jgi:hypothetical protein
MRVLDLVTLPVSQSLSFIKRKVRASEDRDCIFCNFLPLSLPTYTFSSTPARAVVRLLHIFFHLTGRKIIASFILRLTNRSFLLHRKGIWTVERLTVFLPAIYLRVAWAGSMKRRSGGRCSCNSYFNIPWFELLSHDRDKTMQTLPSFQLITGAEIDSLRHG